MEDSQKSKEQDLSKSPDKTHENSGDGILPEEILDAIPEEDRGKVAGIIKRTMISGVMSSNNPIAEKVTSEHISTIISKSDNQDKRDREERKSERNHNLLLIVIALVFVSFLIVFLQRNENLLVKIVIGIISFIGGFGFGQSRKKKES